MKTDTSSTPPPEFKEGFLAGIRYAYKHLEWIDFKTEKPQDGQQVILRFDNGVISPLTYTEDGKDEIVIKIDNKIPVPNLTAKYWLPYPSLPKPAN